MNKDNVLEIRRGSSDIAEGFLFHGVGLRRLRMIWLGWNGCAISSWSDGSSGFRRGLAVGLQQAEALRVQQQMSEVVRRSERSAIAQDTVEKISKGVSIAATDSRNGGCDVGELREMVASGRVRVRTYVESPLESVSVGTTIMLNRDRQSWEKRRISL